MLTGSADAKSNCRKGGILDNWTAKADSVDHQCTRLERKVACIDAVGNAEALANALESAVAGKPLKYKAALMDKCTAGTLNRRAIDRAVSKCHGH